jgi:hypothetical protein
MLRTIKLGLEKIQQNPVMLNLSKHAPLFFNNLSINGASPVKLPLSPFPKAHHKFSRANSFHVPSSSLRIKSENVESPFSWRAVPRERTEQSP